MLELELSGLKKQTNPGFEAQRKISRGLWEEGGKKTQKTPNQKAASCRVCSIAWSLIFKDYTGFGLGGVGKVSLL